MMRVKALASTTIALIASLPLVLVLVLGCEREYDQSSPDATLSSLRAMAANGDIGRATELIHTADPNLDLALARIGDLLQRMYELSLTVREEHPDEVAKLLEKAKAKAAEVVAEQDRRRGDDEFGGRFQRLLVEPEALFTEEFDKLEAVPIADDMAAVTYEGKPLFGVGMIMMLQPDGKWYIDWPETIPGLNKAMPQTDAEWRIMHSILKSIHNGLTWAEMTVAEGETKSLDDVWRQMAEEVIPPVVAGWMIYDQALKARPGADAESGAESSPGSDGSSGDAGATAGPRIDREGDRVNISLTIGGGGGNEEANDTHGSDDDNADNDG